MSIDKPSRRDAISTTLTPLIVASAIAEFLERETVEIKRYIEQAKAGLPYKQKKEIEV